MSLGNEARRGCANFISDNTAGCMPEVWQALSDATVGTAAAYGNDIWTKRLNAAFTEVYHAASHTADGVALMDLALARPRS
jgi:threonine aldolase